jgi:enoyl-CoA hydratase/carnithine racemase
VSRVSAVADLPALLAETAGSIGENAPLTIAAAKAIIGEILKPSPELDAERCRALIQTCFESEDYAEGRQAFMAKRRPVFRGR